MIINKIETAACVEPRNQINKLYWKKKYSKIVKAKSAAAY